MEKNDKPQVFDILSEDALEITHSPYGSVGRLFTGEGLEAVWVKKEAEEIDPGWFVQPMVDLILVVQGELKVEYERPDLEPRILKPGEMLMLPPNLRLRAYRWPREAEQASIFLAVYPLEGNRPPTDHQ
jgi:quercetin dioxygenase-like cupin family protein